MNERPEIILQGIDSGVVVGDDSWMFCVVFLYIYRQNQESLEEEKASSSKLQEKLTQ